MATPFRLKRSAVADRRPTTTDLQLGELALNTHDGFLYAETTGVGSTVSLLTPWREQYGSPTSIYYNHRVGIGSTNPTVSLDVVGDTKLQNNLSVTGITTLGNIVMTTGVISGKLHIPDAGINITDDAAGFYEFQSGGHIQVGTAATNSLQIFHDVTGGHSFISEVGDGDLCLVTNGTNLFLQKDATAGSAEDMIQCIANGEVSLFHNNVKRLATTDTGVNITDNLKVAGISTFINTVNINGVIEANSNLNVDGNLDVDGHTELDNLRVSGISTFSDTVKIGTGVTALTDGNVSIGGTFEIFESSGIANRNFSQFKLSDFSIGQHNNTGSYKIINSSTGNLIIGAGSGGSAGISLMNKVLGAKYLKTYSEGSVEIYYDNALRFETSGIGATVYGQLDSTQLTVSGVSTFAGIATVTGETLFTKQLSVSGVSTFQDDIFVGVGATVGFGTTAYFRDNVKAVFGDDEDLSIYHDGEQSILSEQGEGGFRILTSTFRVRNPGDNSTFMAAAGSYVLLNYGGDQRLKTTEEGVIVSGGTTTGTLNVTGVSTFVGVSTFNDQIFTNEISNSGIITSNMIHLTGGSFTAPHASGETKSDTAIVVNENFGIYSLEITGGGNDNRFLRSIIRKNSDVISIGQSDTALISKIKMIPGDLGSVSIGYSGAVSLMGVSQDGNTPNIEKLRTVGTGITVFGNTETQTLNVSGVSTFNDNTIIDGSLTVGSDTGITGGAPTDQGNLAVYGNGRNSLIIQAGSNNEDRGMAFRNNGDFYVAYISAINMGNSTADLSFGSSTGQSAVGNVTERIRIKHDTGNVGINSAAPTSKLDVVGDAKISGIVTATTFVGNLTGTASTASTVLVSDESTAGNCFPIFAVASVSGGLIQSGNKALKAGSNLAFNSSTGDLVTTKFTGSTVVATGHIEQTSASGISTFSGDLDVDGRTELDITNISETLNVTGISTFTDQVGFGTHITLEDYGQIQLGEKSGGDFFIGHTPTLYSGVYNTLVSTNGNILLENRDTGGQTRFLYLKSNSVQIRSYTGNEAFITATLNQDVKIFYDNSERLATTTYGALLTGGTSGIGTLAGPATFHIDPATVGDNTGTLVVKGNLQVEGTQTTVNSTTMNVADKNVGIASGAANDAAADGGGITIYSGDGDKTFNFESTGSNLGSSENINIATGKVYKVNNVETLSATTLGSAVVNSSLTNLGTLTSLTVTGAIDANGSLDVDGQTTLDDVRIAGVTTITNASGTKILETSNNGSKLFHNGLEVLSTSAYGVDVNLTFLTGQLKVTGISTFTGAIDANGNLDVDGYTELDDLNVSGVSTFVGAIDANGNLDVDGHTELDNVNISGVTTTADIKVSAGSSITIPEHNDNTALYLGNFTTPSYPSGSDGARLKQNTTGNTTFEFNNLFNTGNTFYFNKPGGGQLFLAAANPSVGVRLYCGANNEKLRTVGTGITVFGTTETQQLNVTGISTLTGNVSIAGVTTFQSSFVRMAPGGGDSGILKFGSGNNYQIIAQSDKLQFAVAAGKSIELNDGNSVYLRTSNTGIDITGGLTVSGISTFTGAIDANGNLDVDGHTELDNLNVSGVSTFGNNINASGTSRFEIASMENALVDGEIAHTGDTDTKIAFGNNEIDFQAANSSRLKVTQFGTYVQAGHPFAFLSTTGPTPNIKSGGTNNQDLLFTTGTGNPTRLQITSAGNVGINSTSPTHELEVLGDSSLKGNLTVSGVGTFSERVTCKNLLTSHDGNTGISILDTGHGFSASTIAISNGGRDLAIKAPRDIRLQPSDGLNGIVIENNGPVELYHANLKKVETSVKGIKVGTGVTIETNGQATFTGIVTATGADINGDLDVDGHTELDDLNVSGIGTVKELFVKSDSTSQVSAQILSGDNVTHHNYLHGIGGSSQQGLSIRANEACIELIATAGGVHGGSFLMRDSSNDGFGFVNDPSNEELQLKSFTTSNDDFGISGSGSSVSRIDDCIVIKKDGAVSLFNNGTKSAETTSSGLNVTSANDAVLQVTTTGTSSTDDARIELITQESTFKIQNDRSLGTDGALTISSDGEKGIYIFKDGAVELYHDHELRLSTTNTGVSITDNLNVAGISTFTGVINSTVSTGTAPFTVASTTKVTNLNADLLDGKSTANGAAGNTVVIRNAAAGFSAGDVTFANITAGITTNTGVINSQTDIRINNVSVIETALNDAVAMAIALG